MLQAWSFGGKEFNGKGGSPALVGDAVDGTTDQQADRLPRRGQGGITCQGDEKPLAALWLRRGEGAQRVHREAR
ncbi:hypothetical protein AVME950_18070 [Acidovorax sp. SUPP950]|uniref:hypothetical protein n=1 Tax=Acidovorax sp. SUPP950 TaxID=511901 RepID=UPI0023CFB00B|nr:hypothetical protein [Acidovorax sp. SUPP950]GKS76832.1 hypothetical protein AVME950_18070 [Acidovorax sp. SUPP950]